jgi:hypothetical protein
MERRSSKNSTSITEEKARQYLEELTKSENEPGIRPFVSRMFDIYRNMAMYDWKLPGEYYVGKSRVAFFNQENLQYLIDIIPGLELREAGRELGARMAVSLGAGHNFDPREKSNWPKVLERLRVFGYGDFFLREDYLVTKNPFIANRPLLTGFLEGLLGAKLEPRRTTSPIVFKVS